VKLKPRELIVRRGSGECNVTGWLDDPRHVAAVGVHLKHGSFVSKFVSFPAQIRREVESLRLIELELLEIERG
jgi:hypothetical protein